MNTAFLFVQNMLYDTKRDWKNAKPSNPVGYEEKANSQGSYIYRNTE